MTDAALLKAVQEWCEKGSQTTQSLVSLLREETPDRVRHAVLWLAQEKVIVSLVDPRAPRWRDGTGPHLWAPTRWPRGSNPPLPLVWVANWRRINEIEEKEDGNPTT